MADATEDLVHAGSQTSAPKDTNSDDEAEDIAPNFLNLNLTSTSNPSSHLALTSLNPSAALPKRGEKDFEANPTLLQFQTLSASRQAMHEALSYTRVHNPHVASGKAVLTVVGTYDEETGDTFITRARARGKMFATIGRSKRVCLEGDVVREGFVLAPEEALWALESGRLDVRYPFVPEDAGTDDEDEEREDDEDSEEHLGMPMSLQGAYAAYIGGEPRRGGSLTMERYLVYSALKRAGYIVTRAESWDGKSQKESATSHEEPAEMPASPGSSQANAPGLLDWLYSFIATNPHVETPSQARERQLIGPLVTPGLYRNYSDIYARLRMITYYNPRNTPDTPQTDPSPFTTAFNVYKPSTNYRKTAPGPPDFRICVVSAADDAVPTMMQISSLIHEQAICVPSPSKKPPKQASKDKPAKDKSQPHKKPSPVHAASDAPSSKTKPAAEPAATFNPHVAPNTGNIGHMYSRLKRGQKNVIIAIVDQGVVSYLRFSDSCFGREKLYERIPKAAENAGSKGGGNFRKGGKNSNQGAKKGKR